MINEFEVRERIERFVKEHGDYVCKNHWIYHHDGATRDLNALGPLIEPSRVPVEHFRNVLTYQEEKLRREIEAFDGLKAVLEKDPYAEGDPDEGVKKLMAIRDASLEWQKQVEETREQLRRCMPGYRTPAEIERDAAYEASKDGHRQKIREITL